MKGSSINEKISMPRYINVNFQNIKEKSRA